jgi:hypothetical protein
MNQTPQQRQDQTMKILYQARQLLAESEARGSETVVELDRQNKQTYGSIEKVADVQKDIKKSQSLLQRMSRWWRG